MQLVKGTALDDLCNQTMTGVVQWHANTHCNGERCECPVFALYQRHAPMILEIVLYGALPRYATPGFDMVRSNMCDDMLNLFEFEYSTYGDTVAGKLALTTALCNVVQYGIKGIAADPDAPRLRQLWIDYTAYCAAYHPTADLSTLNMMDPQWDHCNC